MVLKNKKIKYARNSLIFRRLKLSGAMSVLTFVTAKICSRCIVFVGKTLITEVNV